MGFPDSSIGKEPSCNAGDPSSIPEFGKICWKRERLHMPVFLGFPCVSAGKEFFNGETWTQWSFSFSISPFSDYSGLISFRTDWFDLLAVQETLMASYAFFPVTTTKSTGLKTAFQMQFLKSNHFLLF